MVFRRPWCTRVLGTVWTQDQKCEAKMDPRGRTQQLDHRYNEESLCAEYRTPGQYVRPSKSFPTITVDANRFFRYSLVQFESVADWSRYKVGLLCLQIRLGFIRSFTRSRWYDKQPYGRSRSGGGSLWLSFCLSTEFIIEYEESQWEPGNWKELLRVLGSHNSAVLKLHGHVDYRFRVSGVNDVGRGPSSEPSERYKTPPSGPAVFLLSFITCLYKILQAAAAVPKRSDLSR